METIYYLNRKCRTRVFENINGEKTSWHRGNLSFSTINLVRPAIIAFKKYPKDNQVKERIDYYKKLLMERCDLVKDQLLERYHYQCTAKAKQFPFMIQNGLWQDGENLKPNDNVESIIKHGTLGIGFIGLAEALKMLIGKHHGESDEAEELGLELIKEMNKRCELYKNEYKLNFSIFATPAEGLSGKFTAIDRETFGIIPGVTDREYYTNSNHQIRTVA